MDRNSKAKYKIVHGFFFIIYSFYYNMYICTYVCVCIYILFFVVSDNMKLWIVIVHIILVATNLWVTAHFHEEVSEDNEFAEFEDFEEEKLNTHNEHVVESVQESDLDQDFEEDDVLVTDGDSEFDHFQDEEEFEGLDVTSGNVGPRTDEPSTLTITKIPLHLRDRWDSFYLEILMITGLLVYFINYMVGRSKNAHIAEQWFTDHQQVLTENFSLIGTGRSSENANDNVLIKESESQYSLYCSGRVGCDAMFVELRLIKRQDLVAVLAQLVRPQNDKIHIHMDISKDETDNFVLVVASKRAAMHLVRDTADISLYCPEKRPAEKFGLPSGFCVMSEIAEAASAILDTKVQHVFSKFAPHINYIHISDQFSGRKPQE